MKMLLYLIVLLFIGGVVYNVLSGKNESGLETESIEQMTEEAGQEMVDHLRVPIEKARDLKSREDERVRQMEEDMKKQFE